MSQGHSRSCVLGSVKSRRWTAYRYVITWASYLQFPKIYPAKKSENCRCWQPQRISAYTLCRQKLKSMAYIISADSTGLPSFNFFCGGLQKTHLFCRRVRIGCSRSSKVADFSTTRKGICNFLLVTNSNFGPILHHFWDTASYWLKIANFSYPTLI